MTYVLGYKNAVPGIGRLMLMGQGVWAVWRIRHASGAASGRDVKVGRECVGDGKSVRAAVAGA